MNIDLTKWWRWVTPTVVLVAVVIVLSVRSQKQVGIAQSFLDAVKNGDSRGAQALSSGPVRAAVSNCFSGTCGVGPADQAVQLARTSTLSSTSINVHTSWNQRCVEASVRTPSGRHDLFVQVELRGDAWLVTGLSAQRDDLAICSSD